MRKSRAHRKDDLIRPSDSGRLIDNEASAGLDEDAHDIAAQGSAAWDWDDEYAAKRLAEARAV